MISNETEQKIETNGSGIKLIGQVNFDDENRARIMSCLSDKMYSKKELAILREYACNSADEMIENGKDYFGFILTLPTFDDLNVKFRDFGGGLTASEITEVYCNMGTSTKRNSNAYTGTLGFGSKSFSCVSDSVTVTSWNAGEKAIYQIIKGDVRTLPQIYELSRCATDEPTGIEVCIPVKSDIMYTIHEEAADLFKYWDTLPTILNMNEEYKNKMDKFRNTAPTLLGEGWEIRPKSDGSAVGVALMGKVNYTLDWNKISSKLPLNSQTRCLFELLQSNDVVLKYEMGAVQFVPSREHLEYSDLTINALTAKINDIFVKIKNAIQSKFSDAPNVWEAKKIYNSIFGSGLPIETEDGNVNIDNIKILAGNLGRLEESLKGSIKWNNVVISDASFRLINRFDNHDVPAIVNEKDHNPYSPVMTTYRRKNSRLKTTKCKSGLCNHITASDYVAVVINDTNKKSGVAMVARYLLNDAKFGYRSVHMLNFENSDTKDLFYKEYNFETVPTLKLSELMDAAKIWYAANKNSRNSSSGGNFTVKEMEYMDLEGADASVETSDVSFKDIDDTVYFIYAGASRRGRFGSRGSSRVNVFGTTAYASDTAEYIKFINDKLELGIDRVYIVNNYTKNCKWFEKAIAKKEWLPVLTYINDNLNEVNVQELVNGTIDNSCINMETAKLLINEFDDNHPLTDLFHNIISVSKNNDAVKFVGAMNGLQLWHGISKDVIPNIDFKKMIADLSATYPYINWSDLQDGYFNGNAGKRNNFIKYINAIDKYDRLVNAEIEIETEQELVEA